MAYGRCVKCRARYESSEVAKDVPPNMAAVLINGQTMVVPAEHVVQYYFQNWNPLCEPCKKASHA